MIGLMITLGVAQFCAFFVLALQAREERGVSWPLYLILAFAVSFVAALIDESIVASTQAPAIPRADLRENP